MKTFPQRTWSQNVHNCLNRWSPKLETPQCPPAGDRVTECGSPCHGSQLGNQRGRGTGARPRGRVPRVSPRGRGMFTVPCVKVRSRQNHFRVTDSRPWLSEARTGGRSQRVRVFLGRRHSVSPRGWPRGVSLGQNSSNCTLAQAGLRSSNHPRGGKREHSLELSLGVPRRGAGC